MRTASVAHNLDFFADRGPRLRPIAFPSSPPLSETVKRLEYQGAHSVTTCRKSWTGVRAQLAEVRCDGPVEVDLGAERTRLSVVLEEVGGRLDIRARRLPGRSAAHEAGRPLSLIPARLNAVGQAAHVCFIHHLVVEFDESVLAPIFGEEVDLARAFAPRLMFCDRGIMHLAQLFADECARDEPHSLLYGETLALALLLRLSGLSPSAPKPARQGALAPWQIHRVTEYLAEHLAADVQLQTLSDLVNLSRSYFSRSFKSSTGLAPHQWLLQARIAKAKQLLLDNQLPLAQIALEIGFADQAHFTRAFRRAVGQSPGAWQRSRYA